MERENRGSQRKAIFKKQKKKTEKKEEQEMLETRTIMLRKKNSHIHAGS
jgi:hypothetical protein